MKINKSSAIAFNTNTKIWQRTEVIDEILVPFDEILVPFELY